MEQTRSLYFPPFRLDTVEGRLYREADVIPLRPKTFALLHYLAMHAGELVTKETLLDSVWPDAVVSEGGLTELVRELRKELGDNARTPQFIETVHGRGYRFLPSITTQPVPSSKFQVQSSGTQHSALNTQHSVLVGRETELAQLHKWLAKALYGERQLVFVTGEPGIGKTTVVEAFLQQLTANGHVRLSRGQCIEQYGASEAYLPILEAMGRLARQAAGHHLVTVLQQYAPTWLVQMPALLSAEEFDTLQRRVLGSTHGGIWGQVLYCHIWKHFPYNC